MIYDEPRKLIVHRGRRVLRRPAGPSLLSKRRIAVGPAGVAPSRKLHYENLRSSLGSVEAEKGQQSDVYVAANYADGDFVPQVLGTYDFGFQLPLTHSSIWLRNAAGVGFGDRDDPFAQFFFGGFGNNWVDHRATRRYREFYAFPGLELNEVGGRTFAKAILDWNLPPIYFRRVGTPGFFANWARTSIFVAGVTTDFDGKAVRQTLGDAGAQMDIRFTMLSRLPLTLSFGYAAAFERGAAPRHEGMISLKAPRSDPGLGPAAGSPVPGHAHLSRQLQAGSPALGGRRHGRRLPARRGVLARQRRAELAPSRCRGTNYSRYVAPIVEELAKAMLALRPRAHEPHRLFGRRRDLRVRDRDGLRGRREHFLLDFGVGSVGRAFGSFAGSARR